MRGPAALAAALLCGSAGALPAWAGAAELAAGDAGQREVVAAVDALRREAGIASAAVVLLDAASGQTQVASFGVTDHASGTPVGPDTIFRIGSVSKLVTALTLLRAEQAGLLRLSAPVRALAAEAPFDNPWENSHPLRLRHLLEHSAGWHDMSAAEFDNNDARPLNLDQALALAPASRRSHWPPGRHHSYSNSGAGLAAWVLEQRCDCRFEDYSRRVLLEPLGMRSARWRLDDRIRGRLAQGYDRDAVTPIPYWHIVFRPAAALNLEPADMLPLLGLLLGEGEVDGRRLLPAEQMRQARQPQSTLAARHGLDFGYGLGQYAYRHAGHVFFGHGGDADGYLSRLGYSPVTQRAYFVVISAFRHRSLRRLRSLLDDWLAAGRPPPPPPPPAELADGALQRLAGEYRRASSRFGRDGWREDVLRVRVDGSRLQLTTDDGGHWRLLPVDDRRFRRRDDPVATSIFVAEEDGGMVLQGPMGNWRRPPAR